MMAVSSRQLFKSSVKFIAVQTSLNIEANPNGDTSELPQIRKYGLALEFVHIPVCSKHSIYYTLVVCIQQFMSLLKHVAL